MRLRSPIRVGFFRSPSKLAVTAVAPMLTALADLGVAQVGQVPHDRAAAQVRLLDLDERADLDAVVEHGPVAEMRERPDPAVRPDLDRARDHRERVDHRVAADRSTGRRCRCCAGRRSSRPRSSSGPGSAPA